MSEEATNTAEVAETVETVDASEATLTTEGTSTADNAGTGAEGDQTENTDTTAEGDKPEGEGEGEGENAEDGAPEAYAEFTMPEGIELDQELSDQFKSIAKELNLSQDKAQKVVDLAATMRQRDVEAIINLRQEWVDQSKSDTEFGGDKLDQSLATAKKAINAYGTPKFVQLLNESGLGNHPEFVRFCVRAGGSVAEEKVVAGGNSSSTPTRSIAEKLYGPSKE